MQIHLRLEHSSKFCTFLSYLSVFINSACKSLCMPPPHARQLVDDDNAATPRIDRRIHQVGDNAPVLLKGFISSKNSSLQDDWHNWVGYLFLFISVSLSPNSACNRLWKIKRGMGVKMCLEKYERIWTMQRPGRVGMSGVECWHSDTCYFAINKLWMDNCQIKNLTGWLHSIRALGREKRN